MSKRTDGKGEGWRDKSPHWHYCPEHHATYQCFTVGCLVDTEAQCYECRTGTYGQSRFVRDSQGVVQDGYRGIHKNKLEGAE